MLLALFTAALPGDEEEVKLLSEIKVSLDAVAQKKNSEKHLITATVGWKTYGRTFNAHALLTRGAMVVRMASEEGKRKDCLRVTMADAILA